MKEIFSHMLIISTFLSVSNAQHSLAIYAVIRWVFLRLRPSIFVIYTHGFVYHSRYSSFTLNELHKLQLTQVQRAPHRDKQSQDCDSAALAVCNCDTFIRSSICFFSVWTGFYFQLRDVNDRTVVSTLHNAFA